SQARSQLVDGVCHYLFHHGPFHGCAPRRSRQVSLAHKRFCLPEQKLQHAQPGFAVVVRVSMPRAEAPERLGEEKVTSPRLCVTLPCELVERLQPQLSREQQINAAKKFVWEFEFRLDVFKEDVAGLRHGGADQVLGPIPLAPYVFVPLRKDVGDHIQQVPPGSVYYRRCAPPQILNAGSRRGLLAENRK